MFAVFAIALLCLVSVSSSAPAGCEDLVRPVDQVDLESLADRRTLIGGSMVNPEHEESFKKRDSANIKFVNESSQITLVRVFGSGDICQYLRSNVTLEGSTFTFQNYNVTLTMLTTSCPDCVVMRFDNKAKEPQRLYLFSKRREVEQNEMEEFKAQLQCLNMPAPIMLDHTKELCAEEMSKDPADQTEEKTE